MSRSRTFFCLLSALSWSAIAIATDAAAGTFVDTLLQARTNDVDYLNAIADVTVAQKRYRQSSAQMMPQLSASMTINHVDRDYTTLAGPLGNHKEEAKFRADNGSINFTQPLWRPAGVSAIVQSAAVISEREHQVIAAQYELVVRLAQRLLEAMAARDEWLCSVENTAVAYREQQQTAQAASIDLAGQPKLQEARAKYEVALAEKAAAFADREAKIAALEEITGPLLRFRTPFLSNAFAMPDIDVDRLTQLLERVESIGPMVVASRFALAAADSEVDRQRAGYQPTLDLVATYSRNEQPEGNFPGQSGYDIKERSVGVQLNVPIFSSGLQRALVGEAVAMRSKAEYELRGTIRAAISTAKSAWLSLQASSARETAALQSIKSSRLSLATAHAGVAAELNSEVEVLRAHAEFYEAWRDLQRARYDATLNWLKLRATTGELSDQDIQAIDGYFQDRNPIESTSSL